MTCHLTVLLIVLPVVTALLGQFLLGETLVDSPWHNVMTPTMLVTFYISHLKEREISFGSPCYLPTSKRNPFSQKSRNNRSLQRLMGSTENAVPRRKEFWRAVTPFRGGPDVGQMLGICGDTVSTIVRPCLSSMWACRISTDLTEMIKSDFRVLETLVQEAGTQGWS